MNKLPSSKVLEGRSYVNRYELLCLEQAQQGLTEARMVLAFQALDELVPKLGVFSKLFALLRDDFFRAIYSDELTGASDSAESGGGEGGMYIQRLPYFVLVHRVYGDRHEHSEELERQLDIVKKRLFDKHQQLETCQQEMAALQDQIEQLNATAKDLQDTISNKDQHITSLEEEMENNRKNSENFQHQLESDIAYLKDTLSEKKEEIEYLSKFKNGYDKLSDAFMDKDTEEDVQEKQQAVIATKHAYLKADVESANRMEEQILTVLNTAMEEFDRYLEGYKAELSHQVVTPGLTHAELDLQERDLDQADQQLEVVQQRFEATVSAMLSELQLLRTHNNMLLEQVSELEENKPHPPKADTAQLKGPDSKSESILWAGLEEEEEGGRGVVDPFVPQERVFSKYAAMLYTSSNSGRTFTEFKEAKYCASCGEKTVVCPHKMGGTEKVFVLPLNSTHIKITRPKVRINKEMLQLMKKDEGLTEATVAGESVDHSDLSSAAQSFQSNATLTDDLDLAPSTPRTGLSRDSLAQGPADDIMVNSLQDVWEDFKQRTNLQRTVPRTLSLERTMSLVEQFCAYIIYQDEHVDSEDQTQQSILDMVYQFMGQRYLVQDVVYLATHDLLTSILHHSCRSKLLQLLAHTLVGNLDASCLRYVLLVGDFIHLVDWQQVEDFRAFAAILYPSLTEDDLESLQLSYTSFSENRVSKQLVCDFLIHIILKYREPRFFQLETRLVAFQTSENGQLSDSEHKEALESLVPLSNEVLRQRLYLQAHTAVGSSGGVPIMRLAQISGYLALLQISSYIRQNIASRIKEWRERPSSAGSGHHEPLVSHAVEEGEVKLLTLAGVKTLANSMARAAKHRHNRQNESYDEQYEGDNEEDW